MSLRYAVFFWIVTLGCCLAADPSVTNVRAEQRRGTLYVEITYDLVDADTATLAVAVLVSINGDATYFVPVSELNGDVAWGNGKRVVWNAGAELPQKLFSNVRARVTASDMVRIPDRTNNGTDPDYGAYSLTVYDTKELDAI